MLGLEFSPLLRLCQYPKLEILLSLRRLGYTDDENNLATGGQFGG